MGKIHIKGGSPLTLAFTDDQNNPYPEELQLEKTGQFQLLPWRTA